MPQISLRQSALAAALAGVLGLGAPVLAETPIPMATNDFVHAASASDEFEILEAHTALAQSRNLQVRAFAERMIADHTRLEEALKAAVARSGGPPPPPGILSEQSLFLAALQSARGPQFDALYARQQMLAHTQDVDVEEEYAAAGSDPNVRAAVRQGLPVIEGHLQMARELQATLRGS